jgi:NTE family protein
MQPDRSAVASPPSAVVLAGAVAKGAFEAGVLDELTRRPAIAASLTRVVGASAGALNGVMLSAGIRAGDPRGAAEKLLDIWLRYAALSRFAALNAAGILGLQGLSSSRKVLALLEEHVKPCSVPLAQRRPVHLHVVVTATRGSIDPDHLGSFEQVQPFDARSFDEPELLRAVFSSAAASAAFPGVFLPVELDRVGPAVDGGTVNNTPIRYALDELEDLPRVERVFVIAGSPEEVVYPKLLRGVAYINHLAEILVNERLYRDLREAKARNRAIERLEALEHEGAISPATHARIRAALGWREAVRKVEIIPIRPPKPGLEGGAFDAFFTPSLRQRYIDIGRDAAKQALSRAGI